MIYIVCLGVRRSDEDLEDEKFGVVDILGDNEAYESEPSKQFAEMNEPKIITV